uniref:Uncharacterized protein n=1 Tax=Calcidiscus leptoporus TaxID=127549 RepID=A0A7S0JAW6_9EUKA|mmetsp:Transcript_47135/g.109370  ORF Transcript_47135/g.109370 Transcript_47135/m.109370 type:complete len:126 (+) Transcript_47135:162-539(+)
MVMDHMLSTRQVHPPPTCHQALSGTHTSTGNLEMVTRNLELQHALFPSHPNISIRALRTHLGDVISAASWSLADRPPSTHFDSMPRFDAGWFNREEKLPPSQSSARSALASSGSSTCYARLHVQL